MGAVWFARLQGSYGFQRDVAIKTIIAEHSSNPAFRDMLVDEARIASRIDHPNVATMIDFGEHHGILYLAMEWVDGDSLARLHRKAMRAGSVIPTALVLCILADACAGLHAAHEVCGDDGEPLGIVHRDVSPQNILVSTSGTTKVIDFGVAKARFRVHQTDRKLRQVKGKLAYMAPEQASTQPVDRRTDVWSVGAVLYRFLTGRPAHDAGSPIGTILLLSSSPPPPPLPASVHPALAAVVRRALEPTPADRFPTALALKEALEAAAVEAGCAATSSDVAAFARQHLGDREQRRRAMTQAFEAGAPMPRILPIPSDPSFPAAPEFPPAEAIVNLHEEPTRREVLSPRSPAKRSNSADRSGPRPTVSRERTHAAWMALLVFAFALSWWVTRVLMS